MIPLTVSRSGQVTAADTNAHVLPAQTARLVVLQPASGNTGTVTILGVDPNNGNAVDASGIVLAATAPALTLWVQNLNQLAYQLSSANDKLNYLVCR